MPRSPTNYVLPPGTTPQQPNTTIPSAMFNAFADDVAQTLNTEWPSAFLPQASTAARGTVELATASEAVAGQSDTLAVTPASLYYPPGYLYGLTLSNSTSDATNDIDIAPGACRSSDNLANMVLASALEKRLDAAWEVGDGNGGLDTGSIANTTYHVFLIKRPDTGVVDALFSTSATTPFMPTNYTLKRRIGSIIRKNDAILAFSQCGDEFLLKAFAQDVEQSDPGTAAVLRGLTVPAGIQVGALVGSTVTISSDVQPAIVLLSSPDVPDLFPGNNTVTYYGPNVYRLPYGAGGQFGPIRTNTSGQIRSRQTPSSSAYTFRLFTYGWIDDRGRSQ